MTDQEPRYAAATSTIQLGDLTVHRLGFGTMQLTGPGVWGPPADHDAAIAVLRLVVELGVDLIDTANSYGPHVAEELIREALYPYPAHVKIATKAGFVRGGPDIWTPLGRPEHLRAECENSLKRLGVDRIDLFQLHRIDPEVPAADQFGTLRELRDEGKVAEVGLSEVSVADLIAALEIVPIVSVQNLYNLGSRGSDELVDYCTRESIGFIPWFPLASGKLAATRGRLNEIANELGATPAQVCLAWLLQRSPVMLPIPGTSTPAHARENCAAGEVQLSERQFDELTDARRELRRATRR
jgi:aryl-alcohol dehydrogenase-like predicted oxidoreductase